MKKYFYFFIVLQSFLAKPTTAQIHQTYDLYNYNYTLINPAYAGMESPYKFSFSGRLDNYSFLGSGTAGTLSLETYIKEANSGLGLMVTSQQQGVHTISRYSGLYNYQIQLKDSSVLSLGANLSIARWVADFDLVVLKYPDDADYAGTEVKNKLNAGIGIWYVKKNLFAGFSADYLNEPNKGFENVTNNIHLKYLRYYSVVTGLGNVRLSNSFSSNHAIAYHTNFSFWNIDLSSSLEFKKRLKLGVCYRGFNWEDPERAVFSFNTGIKLLKELEIIVNVWSDLETYKESFNGELMVKVLL